MTNLGLRQAKKQIVDFLNGLPFSLEVKRLLVREIYDETQAAAEMAIAQELKSLKEAQDGTGMATSNNSGLEEQPGHDHSAERKQSE